MSVTTMALTTIVKGSGSRSTGATSSFISIKGSFLRSAQKALMNSGNQMGAWTKASSSFSRTLTDSLHSRGSLQKASSASMTVKSGINADRQRAKNIPNVKTDSKDETESLTTEQLPHSSSSGETTALVPARTEDGSASKKLFEGRVFVILGEKGNLKYPFILPAITRNGVFRVVSAPRDILEKINQNGHESGIERNVKDRAGYPQMPAFQTDDLRMRISYSNGVRSPDPSQTEGKAYVYVYRHNFVGVLDRPERGLNIAHGTATHGNTALAGPDLSMVYEIDPSGEFLSVEEAFKKGEKAVAAYKKAEKEGALPQVLTPELKFGKWIIDEYAPCIQERPDGTFKFNRYPVDGERVHVGGIKRDQILAQELVYHNPQAIPPEDKIRANYHENLAKMLADTLPTPNGDEAYPPVPMERVMKISDTGEEVVIDHFHLPAK